MSQFDKLLDRFRRLPKDCTYNELSSLLSGLGYQEDNVGKTSGSRVAFINSVTKHVIRLHKPHPGNIVKEYQMKLIYQELMEQGVIN